MTMRTLSTWQGTCLGQTLPAASVVDHRPPGCVGAPRPPARGTPGPSSQKPAMWPTRLNSATPSSRPLDPVNGTPSGRRASAGVTSGDEVTLRQGGPTPVTGGSMRRGRPGPPGKALRWAEQQGPSPGAPERAAEAARRGRTVVPRGCRPRELGHGHTAGTQREATGQPAGRRGGAGGAG